MQLKGWTEVGGLVDRTMDEMRACALLLDVIAACPAVEARVLDTLIPLVTLTDAQLSLEVRGQLHWRMNKSLAAGDRSPVSARAIDLSIPDGDDPLSPTRISSRLAIVTTTLSRPCLLIHRLALISHSIQWLVKHPDCTALRAVLCDSPRYLLALLNGSTLVQSNSLPPH
jgi:hypothetical protein